MERAKVYFITLSTRADRRRKFEAWARREAEPWSPLMLCAEAFVAEKHPRGSVYGCWHSHMSVMRLALAAGAPYALIMEDDAVPTSTCRAEWNATVADVNNLLLSGHHWDMIGLGGLPLTWIYRSERVPGTRILMTPFVEMHAYLVSAEFMRRATSRAFTGGVDYAYARTARAFLV
jgi:GR25 family glycosyltransferase involved in LPS biosynthesis